MGTFLLLLAAFVLGALAGHFHAELKAVASGVVAKLRAWREKA